MRRPAVRFRDTYTLRVRSSGLQKSHRPPEEGGGGQKKRSNDRTKGAEGRGREPIRLRSSSCQRWKPGPLPTEDELFLIVVIRRPGAWTGSPPTMGAADWTDFE